MWLDIDNIKDLIKSPLFGNRYVAVFSGNDVFSNKNFGYMVNNITLPTYVYNAKQQYIGGINTIVVNMFEQGQLDMTVYNTGDEYNTIYKWGEKHYNQKTRCYGYMNDIYAELRIYEYDRASNIVLTHIFEKCNLYTYGGLQLTYEESTQIETFQVSLQYRSYRLEKK